MRSLLFLLFLFIVSGYVNNRIFAQTEKVLHIDLIIPDEELGKVVHKFEVPKNFDFEKSLIGGGFATVDCIKCALTSSYQFWVYKAEKINGEKLELGVKTFFENKTVCNKQKEVLINQNKRETINLKCGVKVITYYQSKSEVK